MEEAEEMDEAPAPLDEGGGGLDEARAPLDEDGGGLDEGDSPLGPPDEGAYLAPPRPWEEVDKVPDGSDWIPERIRKAARSPKESPCRWTLRGPKGAKMQADFYDGELTEADLERWVKKFAKRFGFPVAIRVRGGSPARDLAMGSVFSAPDLDDQPRRRSRDEVLDELVLQAVEDPQAAMQKAKGFLAGVLPALRDFASLWGDAVADTAADRTIERLRREGMIS